MWTLFSGTLFSDISVSTSVSTFAITTVDVDDVCLVWNVYTTWMI
jgi:hypothetical protein